MPLAAVEVPPLPRAAVTGVGTEPVIPFRFDIRAAQCPVKSTKKDKNVLSGLGLLQLLPPLLQGRSDPPPLLQVLGTSRGLAGAQEAFQQRSGKHAERTLPWTGAA